MNPIANYNLSNLNQAFQIFNELENFVNQGRQIFQNLKFQPKENNLSKILAHNFKQIIGERGEIFHKEKEISINDPQLDLLQVFKNIQQKTE